MKYPKGGSLYGKAFARLSFSDHQFYEDYKNYASNYDYAMFLAPEALYSFLLPRITDKIGGLTNE